jgi:ribosome maturation factor RimP
MIDVNHIRKLAEEKLEGSGLFLADVLVKPGNRIFVFLDGDHDVTIEDCASLSRHLEEAMADAEDHELMVSSFGADQPLKFPRQYNKNVGRSLKVTLADLKDISGILTQVDATGITLHPEKKKKKKKDEPEMPDSLYIAFDQIKSAKVNLSFNQK